MGMSIGPVLNVVPAMYSRPSEDHKSPEGVRRLWESGKDFMVVPEGPYMSKRDIQALTECGFEEVRCLYGERLSNNVSLWRLS